MSKADLALALDWAASEGWNPGLDDAAAFYATDPDGFLMGWINQTPVAAISAVRHNDDFGFLGLYICHPDYRGTGLGWEIWQAAMNRFKTRTIGLDGVEEQQGNYAKSGFVFSHNTIRHQGTLRSGAMGGFSKIKPEMVEISAKFEAGISGVNRPAYMNNWLTDTNFRRSLVLVKNHKIHALGTIRKCIDGFKIGPLYAPDADIAGALARALLPIGQSETVAIDAPSHNPAAVELCDNLGLEPVFSTARMYKGQQTPALCDREFGVVTMELG